MGRRRAGTRRDAGRRDAGRRGEAYGRGETHGQGGTRERGGHRPPRLAAVLLGMVALGPTALASCSSGDDTSAAHGARLGTKDEAAYTLPGSVLFDVDSATIRPDAQAVLLALARSLRETYPAGRITVVGHTDSTGAESYNDQLSVQRAVAVKRWLVDRAGFDDSRIEAQGRGEHEPVASDDEDDDAARQRNRRVEILLERPTAGPVTATASPSRS